MLARGVEWNERVKSMLSCLCTIPFSERPGACPYHLLFTRSIKLHPFYDKIKWEVGLDRVQYREEEINMSQFKSTVVDAIALYSAFILERATVGCFFVLQEM